MNINNINNYFGNYSNKMITYGNNAYCGGYENDECNNFGNVAYVEISYVGFNNSSYESESFFTSFYDSPCCSCGGYSDFINSYYGNNILYGGYDSFMNEAYGDFGNSSYITNSGYSDFGNSSYITNGGYSDFGNSSYIVNGGYSDFGNSSYSAISGNSIKAAALYATNKTNDPNDPDNTNKKIDKNTDKNETYYDNYTDFDKYNYNDINKSYTFGNNSYESYINEKYGDLINNSNLDEPNQDILDIARYFESVDGQAVGINKSGSFKLPEWVPSWVGNLISKGWNIINNQLTHTTGKTTIGVGVVDTKEVPINPYNIFETKTIISCGLSIKFHF